MSKVIVIAAPSGTGKTSLIESLLKEDRGHTIKLGVSFTTRKKRENEAREKRMHPSCSFRSLILLRHGLDSVSWGRRSHNRT